MWIETQNKKLLNLAHVRLVDVVENVPGEWLVMAYFAGNDRRELIYAGDEANCRKFLMLLDISLYEKGQAISDRALDKMMFPERYTAG